MKVTSVELHPQGSSAVHVLSFRDPTRQLPYNVREIGGLDADSLVPKFSGTATDGVTKFYELGLQSRDLVVKIELNPIFKDGKTYSDLRDDLYKIIASSRTGFVDVWFKNGETVVAVLSGWVSKFESELFEKAPLIILTIRTDDPILRSPTLVEVDVSGFNQAVPFVIEDLESTAPHGFDVVIQVVTAFPVLVLNDPNDGAPGFMFEPIGQFMPGDVIHISTDFKTRQIYVIRSGTAVPVYLADRVYAGSVWPIMFPGETSLEFKSQNIDGVATGSVDLTSLSYYPTYWGV